jgi:two-component system, OmpR family, phosphate regulon response regulator OmpR
MSELEPHLLVVDDDARLRELLRRYLSENRFRVTTAADAGEARAQLASFSFDLVVLDVMIPGESGLDLTRALRSELPPVLLLTAMAEPEDRVNGLEQGADDYLSKPFEPRELVLRIRNLLQRRPPAGEADRREIRFGDCRFDVARSELFRGADIVRLTAAETGLLASLAQKVGEAVSREELSQSAQFSGNVRNVDVQMTRLRRKIERDPRFPRYLQTVRGTGYVLKPD